MFQEEYKTLMACIVPKESLINETVKQINEQVKPKSPHGRPFYRKPVTIVAVALICLFITMPVFAQNVPIIYNLLYLVSPATAQYFKPIQASCEFNGIKMDVVATYIHENTAEIYITMQDLTGDRVDETIDLNDSYSILRPFGGNANCERIDYDPETKTASFLIRIAEWGKHDIRGDKLTFSVRNFISEKHEYEGIPIPIDFETITEAPRTKEVSLSGYSGSNLGIRDGKQINHSSKVITPSKVIYTPVKGIDITGIGYVDGKLHIQTAVTDSLQNDNHSYFFLEDKDSNKIKYDYSAGFIEYGEPGNTDTRVDYDEYVFAIPQSDIINYSLYGTFYTAENYTEGPWQVTFPLVESGQTE